MMLPRQRCVPQQGPNGAINGPGCDHRSPNGETPGVVGRGGLAASHGLQQYGFTPLTLSVANNATTGAGNRINATSSEVTVTSADRVKGLFAGPLMHSSQIARVWREGGCAASANDWLSRVGRPD
jgi:hypothetical protein